MISHLYWQITIGELLRTHSQTKQEQNELVIRRLLKFNYVEEKIDF